MKPQVMNSLRMLSLITLVMLSAGCQTLFGKQGYFRDRGDDYVQAKSIEPVRLPQGVQSQSIGQLFVIPPIADPDAPLSEVFAVPRPILGAGENARNEVKIQKLGERRWVAVNAAPSAVWPRLRTFITGRGMALAVMDPTQGVLETDWLSIKGDPGTKDRYRFRLEQGIRPDTTEIHILQMTVSENVRAGGQVNWPAVSVNAQREQWMIGEASAFLAKEETTQASMLAQAISASSNKVVLQLPDDGSQPSIQIFLDYQRAWASVGGALSSNGFHVEDMNREGGEFQASFSPSRANAAMRAAAARQSNEEDEPPQQEPGIFSKIGNTFGMGKDDQEDRPDDLETFNVYLLQGDGAIEVRVRDTKGNDLDAKAAGRWLRLIRPNLV